eukprot:TRINITY_DN311_c0_g1_i7.p1 TRINITY_DN311_c0_g1~~TRINITY_DN311_c0_g1_i7.p1  ORF type:complete len:145 (-),score=40.84 TRINITY_DN311_c0_g1_i7:468-902(-)
MMMMMMTTTMKTMELEQEEEKGVLNLVSTLPRNKIFKSFIFDEKNVWVGFYAQKLKQILPISLCEHQQVNDESVETLWKFLNNSTTKLYSNSLARNLLHKSIKNKNSIIEIFFPVEKLELFVCLINKLSQSHGLTRRENVEIKK